MTTENELNKILEQQSKNLVFEPEQINNKIKKLLQEHQYNEWEVDFSEIWDRVSFRCLEKVVP